MNADGHTINTRSTGKILSHRKELPIRVNPVSLNPFDSLSESSDDKECDTPEVTENIEESVMTANQIDPPSPDFLFIQETALHLAVKLPSMDNILNVFLEHGGNL